MLYHFILYDFWLNVERNRSKATFYFSFLSSSNINTQTTEAFTSGQSRARTSAVDFWGEKKNPKCSILHRQLISNHYYSVQRYHQMTVNSLKSRSYSVDVKIFDHPNLFTDVQRKNRNCVLWYTLAKKKNSIKLSIYLYFVTLHKNEKPFNIKLFENRNCVENDNKL